MTRGQLLKFDPEKDYLANFISYQYSIQQLPKIIDQLYASGISYGEIARKSDSTPGSIKKWHTEIPSGKKVNNTMPTFHLIFHLYHEKTKDLFTENIALSLAVNFLIEKGIPTAKIADYLNISAYSIHCWKSGDTEVTLKDLETVNEIIKLAKLHGFQYDSE